MIPQQKISCSPMPWNAPAAALQNYHADDGFTAFPVHIRLSSLVNELFAYRSQMPASADDVYAWHARPDALTQLIPPWENARVIDSTGSIEQPGSRVKFNFASALSYPPGPPSIPLASRDECFAMS
jgi:hypothetical protein